MNKQAFTLKISKPKHRAHFVLFAEDSPFKPKVVKRKDLYQRKPKHVGRVEQD